MREATWKTSSACSWLLDEYLYVFRVLNCEPCLFSHAAAGGLVARKEERRLGRTWQLSVDEYLFSTLNSRIWYILAASCHVPIIWCLSYGVALSFQLTRIPALFRDFEDDIYNHPSLIMLS